MTTQQYDPLTITHARDAERSMQTAISDAERAGQTISRARQQKRDADAVIRDREAYLTLDALAGGNGEKTNAELRKAQMGLALAADSELQRLRRTLALAQQDIDTAEFDHDHALKRYHAAKASLDYATAITHLYANGGSLHG